MAEFVFTSPGVKFKERDLTYVTRNVGITTLGLVGETLKGPAFEPVFIQDKGQFQTRFGAQSTKRFQNADKSLQYQLPYVANAYLEESQQLWVTRVLGLSGYDAGTAWMITLSAGVDPETIGVETVSSPIITGFTDSNFLGVPISSIGQTGVHSTEFVKQNGDTFEQLVYQFTAMTLSMGVGTVRYILTVNSGASYAEYENMVLAVIRSRGHITDVVNNPAVPVWYTNSLEIIGNTTTGSTGGNLFNTFTLFASGNTETSSYTVSLNPNDSNFLPNVIGYEPKDKNTLIWVESIYPDLIKKLDVEEIGYGINNKLIVATGSSFTDYKTYYQTPETPWVVSQLKGTTVDKLFKFISISDGNAANQEIKITIANINLETLEFDVYIRDFYDTDANPNVLESFTKCTMLKGSTNYIGQRIGTSDGEYSLMSKYVMVEIADDVPFDVFPAGFEGYEFKNYGSGVTGSNINGKTPKIFYKTEYNISDKINKRYLAVSETGYDVVDDVNGRVILKGNGINQNFFNFIGQSGFVNSKGFHMDMYATGSSYNGFQFEVGAGKFQTLTDVLDPLNPYYNIKTRKFTLVPAGGFDGWNVNRNGRTYGDYYRQGGIFDGNVSPTDPVFNDFQAWEMGIDTFSNPENVTINLFATPGINWKDQTILVQNTIEMIEQERTDTLYIIDSPEIKNAIPQVVGVDRPDVDAANDIVDALNTVEIDSSYSCTYYPWIQIRDTQNNVNVYIPPTGEVAKAMAFTDNTKFPWFAPAGLNRGVTNARKSMYKLSLEARDILYAGRINPMADFADAGTAIFGQKTLQVKESALDRINVRRLLLQIKVLIANIAIRLVFEQNDQATIDQFLAKANPILDSIKRERGLVDFRIKMDDSNNTPESRDRNELYGEIFLKPTRAVEFIGITFTITPSGASFSDVGA